MLIVYIKHENLQLTMLNFHPWRFFFLVSFADMKFKKFVDSVP